MALRVEEASFAASGDRKVKPKFRMRCWGREGLELHLHHLQQVQGFCRRIFPCHAQSRCAGQYSYGRDRLCSGEQ